MEAGQRRERQHALHEREARREPALPEAVGGRHKEDRELRRREEEQRRVRQRPVPERPHVPVVRLHEGGDAGRYGGAPWALGRGRGRAVLLPREVLRVR